MKNRYKSLYPSIMLEFNIAPNTQIGRIIIPCKVYEHENAYMIPEEKYSRSGEFIENMVTDNVIEYCKRWFHLAGFEEFLSDIDEFYGSDYGKFSNLQSAFNSPIEPISDKVETSITFVNTNVESPIIFYNKKSSDLTFESITMKGKF